MSQNPYASPAPVENAGWSAKPTGPIRLASQGQRFANFILDFIVIQVISGVAGFVIGMAYIAMNFETGLAEMREDATMAVLSYAAGFIATLAYFIISESLFQRTLGKLASGTIVIAADGSRPTFGQIVGRSFARFIPFEAFSFLVGSPPVGWHDSLSGTHVMSLN